MSFARLAIRRQFASGLTRTTPISARPFSSTYLRYKTTTESVKEGLDNVNKVAGQKLADGIEAAASTGTKVKESIVGKNASATAEELKGQAKGTAEVAKGKVNAATEEVKSKL